MYKVLAFYTNTRALRGPSIEILSNFCPKKPQLKEIGHKSSVLFEFYEGAPGY